MPGLKPIVSRAVLRIWFIGFLAAACVASPGSDAGTPPPEASRAPASAQLTRQPSSQTVTPLPTRQSPDRSQTTYTIQPGDTLYRIASNFGITMEELRQANTLLNPDQLAVGQVLQIPLSTPLPGPADRLIPDSELVYGPAYADFDIAAATAGFPGWFNRYTETVNGRSYTAAELVQEIALQYSVGPRVLLTLIELRSGWLTNPDPSPEARRYPLGYANPNWDGLQTQLSVAANALNMGFYGWYDNSLWTQKLDSGEYVQFSAEVNAGTLGVQRALLPGLDYAAWQQQSGPQGFLAVYQRLFGDPFTRAVELLPANLQTPALDLPWERGKTWYFTGGPHAGWDSGSPWAALDFVTGEKLTACESSQEWVTAAAPGQILFSDNGMVLQDIDDDGFPGTGWLLLYMHVASRDRTSPGSWLKTGDRIGHPSCEGGVSTATHLHFARRYNGMWIAADDSRWPLVLSGWRAGQAAREYDGTLTLTDETAHAAAVKTACECWETLNALLHSR